jgi:hypothetical protein
MRSPLPLSAYAYILFTYAYNGVRRTLAYALFVRPEGDGSRLPPFTTRRKNIGVQADSGQECYAQAGRLSFRWPTYN